MSFLKVMLIAAVVITGLFCGCAATQTTITDHLGVTVDVAYSDRYQIRNITFDTLPDGNVKVFCRVNREGKRVRGMMAVTVMSSSGSTVFSDTVASSRDTRTRAYTQSDLGFPFTSIIPAAVVRNSVIRLVFIEDALSFQGIKGRKKKSDR